MRIKDNIKAIIVGSISIAAVISLIVITITYPFLSIQKGISGNLSVISAIGRSLIASETYQIKAGIFKAYNHRENVKTGTTQVFIPEGSFIMGANDGVHSVNSPQHLVSVASYWIDVFEVTNGMYKNCVRDGACTPPAIVDPFYSQPLFYDYPVVYITWFQADQYCKWSGGNLPTEAEWEKAARGVNGDAYPWGTELPDQSNGNFGSSIGTIVSSYTYSNGISPYGALNMSGNVREWVSDWFNPTYYQRTPANNPLGSSQGANRSLRGGSYLDPADRITAFHRYSHEPESPGINRGFRCVTHD